MTQSQRPPVQGSPEVLQAGRYFVERLCAGDDSGLVLGDPRPMAGRRVASTVRQDRAGNAIPYTPI
jgi:hypothetical protein